MSHAMFRPPVAMRALLGAGRWLALAAGLVLAACGSGGGSEAPPAPAPTEIVSQPASLSVPAGSDAAFSVTARGERLVFQWQSSTDRGSTWSDIAGATSAAYTRTAVDAAQDGLQLRVRVQGAAGAVISSAATLTVQPLAPPAILTQPADLSVTAGGQARFFVTASGTSPAYRWQRSADGGNTWADIGGATAATLTLDVVSTSDSGARVRVVVSNAAGSVTSAAALLTVTPAPSAPAITTQPQAANVVAPQPASFSVVANGTPPLAYQWQRSGDGGTTYADIAGATATSFTLDPTAAADNGLLLRVRVSNAVGNVTSSAARLGVSVASLPPRFLQLPTAQVVTAPAPATFSALTDGSPTPALQWQASSDGGATYANINGATTSSYTTPATTLADNLRLFRIVATNAAGSSTTPGAPLFLSGVLGLPYAVAIDARGDLTFTALPNAQTTSNTFAGLIQFRTSSGATGTLAGSPVEGFVNGTGAGARFSAPLAVAVGLNGTVYVAEIGNRVIRRVSATGVVTTFAGTGATGFQDGPAASATFFGPSGLALDAGGTLYVADGGWNTIRRVGTDGIVTTLAGGVDTPGFVDGSGTAARFAAPRGLATDAAGNVFVADRNNNAIRRITPAGVVSTLAGGGTSVIEGVSGFVDAAGRAARFNDPHAVAVDGAGNVYVADRANHAIRKVTPAGVVTTLAGNGTAGFADGIGTTARFSGPQGVAVDAAGNVYVADTGNRALRRIAPDGTVITLAR